jgi:hypothetical protein
MRNMKSQNLLYPFCVNREREHKNSGYAHYYSTPRRYDVLRLHLIPELFHWCKPLRWGVATLDRLMWFDNSPTRYATQYNL